MVGRSRITCVMPAYLRPERTKRAIQSVLSQQFVGFQLIIVFDGCPHYKHLKEIDWIRKEMDNNQIDPVNTIEVIHLEQNHSDYGSYARWIGIQKATAPYVCFLDNDDIILSKHFESYCTSMEENPDVDLGYFNSYIEPIHYIRQSSLNYGAIGHSEIIVKTSILKDKYVVDPTYGHDWNLISSIVNGGYKTMYFNKMPTYIVKSLQSHRETGID